MKIEDKRKKDNTFFSNVPLGCVFEYNGVLFMKISHMGDGTENVLSFNEKGGCTKNNFSHDAVIRSLKIKLVIEE